MNDTDAAPPGWLDDDAVQRWRERAAGKDPHDLDRTAVGAVCLLSSWWERARAAVDRIEDAGDAAWTGTDGEVHRHPAYLVEAFLANQLHELTSALGLEPDGRVVHRPTRILFLDEGDTLHEI